MDRIVQISRQCNQEHQKATSSYRFDQFLWILHRDDHKSGQHSSFKNECVCKKDVCFIYPHARVVLVKKSEDMKALSPNLLCCAVRVSRHWFPWQSPESFLNSPSSSSSPIPRPRATLHHSLAVCRSVIYQGTHTVHVESHGSWWYTSSTLRCLWDRHKRVITRVKYRLFHRCFMKIRIRTCFKHTDDKSSLSFN